MKNIKPLSVVLSLCIALTFGCVNNSNQEHEADKHIHNHEDEAHDHAPHAEDDGHKHEAEETEALNTYIEFIDGYEVFMEMDHFVLRETNSLHVHITNLVDYKPIANHEIVIKINNDPKLEKHAHSHGKGIYHFTFRPEQLKKLDLSIIFKSKGESVQLDLDPFLVYKERDMAPAYIEPNDELVTFTKEMAWANDFMLQKVEKQDFARVVKTSGQIVPSSNDEIIVNALHAGIISFNTNLVEGMAVTKDKTIGKISSDLIHQNLNTHFLKTKGEYEKAQLDYERAQKLVDEKLITETDFLEVQLNYQNAKNEYENISRYYSGGQKHLVAPFDGFIRSVFVKQGQFVEEGEPIVSIIKNKRSMLKADLPQQYNHLVSGIYQANFSPVYTQKVFSTKELNGKRVNISNVLPVNSMFIPVYFEFDAKEDIIPGSYVEVYLKSNLQAKVITLPNTALMEDQGNYYVFVMHSGDKYRKQYVSLGDSDGESVEIVEGITANDFVVVKGAYQVYLASLSKAAPAHTHAH